MNMTDEEKAKEIGRKWYYDGANDVAYRSALQMAKWKDKQMIEKAAKWLDSIMYYVSKEDKRLVCDFTDFDGLVNDFKKAMED